MQVPEIERIKDEHDRLAAQCGERHILVILVLEREIGRLLPNADICSLHSPPRRGRDPQCTAPEFLATQNAARWNIPRNPPPVMECRIRIVGWYDFATLITPAAARRRNIPRAHSFIEVQRGRDNLIVLPSVRRRQRKACNGDRTTTTGLAGRCAPSSLASSLALWASRDHRTGCRSPSVFRCQLPAHNGRYLARTGREPAKVRHRRAYVVAGFAPR